MNSIYVEMLNSLEFMKYHSIINNQQNKVDETKFDSFVIKSNPY